MNQPATSSASDTSAKPIPSAVAAASAPANDEPLEEGIIFNSRRVTQAFVLVAAAIAFWMFWVAGNWVGYPAEYKHAGSVLFQTGGAIKLLVFWIVLLVATAVATMLTSWRWFLAGLFAACLGSAAWAIRGGVLRYVLFSASSPSVFLMLALEQVLLAGGVAVLWLVLWQLQHSQPLAASLPAERNDKEQLPAAPGDPIFAVAMQTLGMGILVLLLAATDSNKQVSASVFIAAACATALAQTLQKGENLGRWYWVGPLLVGLIGYLGCYYSHNGWDLGQPVGTFAPLARPLPICYVSFGMAGALMGLWMTDMVMGLSLGVVLSVTHTRSLMPEKYRRRRKSVV